MGGDDEIGTQLAEIHEDPELRRRGEEWLRAVEQFDADAVDYWNERAEKPFEPSFNTPQVRKRNERTRHKRKV